MTPDRYRYVFLPHLPWEEVELTFLLARIAAEGLHGAGGLHLDAGYRLDARTGTAVLDATTPAGRDLNRLFAGFLAREFGPDGFRVERLVHGDPATSASNPRV
jgi:hypothetical protein